jgi:hypothetical protein
MANRKPPTAHELYTWAKGLTTDGKGPTVAQAARYWQCTQQGIRDAVDDASTLPRGCYMGLNVAVRIGAGIYDLPKAQHEIEAFRDD